MTCSMRSICKSSLRRICGSQNLNEKNQVYVEKTNQKITRTYGEDAEDAVNVGASKRKSETNGVNKYQNKFQGTDSLGRKGHDERKSKINVAKQTHQPKGTSSCQHKMEIKVKLEIKILKYSSRKKVSQSRTFSRKPQWKKIAMKDNYMWAGMDHNLNAKRKGWNPGDHPDYNLFTIGDKIGYLDFCKDVMAPMNHNLSVLPTQPLPPRDSNRWNDQIREFNSRHHLNGSLRHFLSSHCQDQILVNGEPLQNVSLLLQRQTPMADGINSSSLQRLIYETGLGGNSPFPRCTVQLSVYGKLSGASTFSTGYSTDESRNEDTVSILILEQTGKDHTIQEEKGELGNRRDLPNNYSYQSRAKMGIRKIDSMSAFTIEADIKESVETSQEQFVWSELHSNQVLRIQNSPCQSAQSSLESSSRANEFVLFLKESRSVFTDSTHSTTPALETSPNKTYLVANGLAVCSETLPGETHSGIDVSTEADVEPLKPSAIREDDCTSCQQVLLCGNIDTNELKYTAAIEGSNILAASQELVCARVVPEDKNLPVCEQLHTCSDIPSGGQSEKEHHLQRNKNIYVPEQLEYYKAFWRTHSLTAMKTFPQDQAIRKDNATFASKQIATEPSFGEDDPTHAQFPIVDVAVQANGYSPKTISEANKIIQSRQKGDNNQDRRNRTKAVVNHGPLPPERSEKSGVFLSESKGHNGEAPDDSDHSMHERGSFSNFGGGRGDNNHGRNRPKAVFNQCPLPLERSEKNGDFLSESKGHNGEAPDDFDHAMDERGSFSNFGSEDSNNSRSGNIEYIRNYISKAARRKGVSKEHLLVSHQTVDANVPDILIILLNCPANLNGFRERRNVEGDDAENRSIYNLRQQNEELRRNQYCIICCTNRRCVVLIPCGHLVICLYCKTCVKQTCPICRGKISEKIKVLFE